ncbi:hypothetical protein GCM10010112_49330 [Actinoplanes lobatus]|uniref:1,4-alpha-glucan branching enzyme n=1 Tax=Actinoplanes lobatus TaxID=113568 RepID=A0A7W7HP24_9ACTN|nr:alpha-amylase family glycosyl hydrolase [Actinoplanes lobatus]MBB4754092.1 1,4-alpha-glucan branching enzyme [Actinoplanes lobatus]GGN76818.1 hypothetical protein GCM10010112_49330 [Actinoplanes lobatus]GIE40852.1 hypothetical protein Alo02nite_37500 [Actinoplanes lobatus]
MYQNFGATVEGATVTFRVFLPDARKDPSQYNGDAFPGIRTIRVAGTFQRAGGWAWDVATAPELHRRDHPSGDLYECAVSGLDDGWYEYKYFVTFQDGHQRWVTDPCTKYLARNDENSGFVIGGPPVEIRDLAVRRPLSGAIFYELHPLDASASYRGARSPFRALIDRLDHIRSLGVNAIQLMPFTGWWGGGWGYTIRHFFAVEEQLVADPARPASRLHELGRFIDACHERDLAVFVDAVLNHVDAGSDPGTGFGYRWLYRNPADSPYLGRYEGGLFLNDIQYGHGCAQQFATDVCRYWLDRFKCDGLRLDYARGYLREDDVTTGAGRLIRDLRDHLDWTGRERVPLVIEHLPEDRSAAIATVNRFQADGMWFESLMFELRNANLTGRPSPDLLTALAAGEGFTAGGRNVGYLSNHDYRTFLDWPGAGGRAQWWRMQPALVALFTVPGAVLLRNGEEFGQQFAVPGFDHPDRQLPRPVDWSLADDEIGHRLIGLHRRLAQIRRENPVLRTGRFKPFPYVRSEVPDPEGLGVHTARGLVVYALTGDRHAIVALNFAGTDRETTVAFPHQGTWEELLDDADLKVLGQRATFTVPGNWARIFVCTE